MINYFINRPVMSMVVSIIILILGVLGLIALPVTQYPDIAPPTVSISANYNGASAATVLQSVVIPLEEAVNGVEGMTYITSSAANDGSASVQIFFEEGVDPDIAAVNVQNLVNRALPILPAEVTRSGVTTVKARSGALMFLSFYSTNPEYNSTYIQNYMNINIISAVKRIHGVANAQVFGGKDYSMRIWLNPDKLAVFNLVPADVIAAINDQSREAAAGQLGQNSGNSFEYTLKYKGKLKEAPDYENIIIKALGNGQILRLKDVADIQFDALSYASAGESNGNPSVSMGIFQTPGSNAQDIIKDIKSYLTSVEPNLPEGIHYTINYDTNEFLDASIKKVVSTLFEAFILVFIVVFIFLQDFRSTLIPAISVPVSIVGSFFFLNLFGFSLNLLTLFALVLAIGIVVDDAIVVVEAVHSKLESGFKNPKKATESAMHEITGAIISITLVMAAVFIPVSFIQGPVGKFYQQFGITLIVAILISAVNALTLSPVLCSLFLKAKEENKEYQSMTKMQKFFYKFNEGFKAATQRYSKILQYILVHRWIALLAIVIALLGIYFINNFMPKGFVPSEDRGIIFANIELQPGASLERTYNVCKELSAKAQKVEGVRSLTFATGRSFLSGNGGNTALAFVRLKPFKERNSAGGQTVQDITKKLFGVGAKIADAKIIFFSPPSIPGYGNSAGFSIVLLDKSGGEIAELANVSQNFMQALSKRPEIAFTQSSFNLNYPQYTLNLDVAKAEMAGVSVNSIIAVLQGYIGGIYAADFTKFGKQYRVMVQAPPKNRANKESLNNLYVRTSTGQMSPVSQYVTLSNSYGPQSINRFNLFTSVNITGSNSPEYSSGDALKAVEEVAATNLNANYGIDYTGLTRDEEGAGNQTLLIFMLSFLFVYFILAAQYESFVLPFAVMFSLPFGVMGAFLGQWIMGLENNIYFQISLIMLLGLLAKNAILIVEFAKHHRENGESIVQSAIYAAKARLRPILMTSFAFIFGMMPLVFATGIGAVGNRSIGTGAVFGLLIGTLLGILIIPTLYVIFEWLSEKVSFRKDLKKLSIFLILIGFLHSCKVVDTYENPTDKISGEVKFRLDKQPEDSLSFGSINWKEIFTDSLLQQYIQKSIDQNLDVRMAIKNMEMANAYMQQAHFNTTPTLSTNPSINYATASLNTQFGQLIGTRQHLVQYGFPLQMSWEIDVWGKLKSQRKALAADYMASISGHQAVVSQLVASVASAYFQLLAYDEQKKIIEQSIAYRTQYVETAKALKIAGNLTEVAVKQAEAQLLNAKGQWLMISQNIKTQENYLQLYMAQSPDSLARSNLDAQKINPRMQSGYPLQLLENRPDLRQAAYILERNFENVQVAKTLLYPSFNITASAGFQSIDVEKLFSINSFFASILGGLTQPILNQKKIKTQIAVSKSAQEISFLQYRKTMLNAVLEVSNALNTYDTQTQLVALKQEEFENYALATEYSSDLVNSGLGNYLEIILANEKALNAKLEFIQAKYNQLNSQVLLYKALGGGWQ